MSLFLLNKIKKGVDGIGDRGYYALLFNETAI
jgi:hypothetical protein